MKNPNDPTSLHMQAVELSEGPADTSKEAICARVAETAGEMLQVAVRIGRPVESMAAVLVALSALQRLTELEGFNSAKMFAAAEEIALSIRFDVERAAGDA
jgi:hypothetical protein